MSATRRTRFNDALDRAIDLARDLDRPLLVLEALRCDYPWASERHHGFIIQGMRDNAAEFSRAGIRYYPYVEPRPAAGKGLVPTLARDACAVVTDDYPCFFLPRMLRAAADAIDVQVEAVDSNGLFPLRALPESVTRRWPRASKALLDGSAAVLARLPVDHEVNQSELEGGARAGRRRLAHFVGQRLQAYAQDRNDPDRPVTSGLSPYLHFGHVSPHEVLVALAAREARTPADMLVTRRGARLGWWGTSS